MRSLKCRSGWGRWQMKAARRFEFGRRLRPVCPWLGDLDESEWFKDAIHIDVRGLKDADSRVLSMFTPTTHKIVLTKMDHLQLNWRRPHFF